MVCPLKVHKWTPDGPVKGPADAQPLRSSSGAESGIVP